MSWVNWVHPLPSLPNLRHLTSSLLPDLRLHGLCSPDRFQVPRSASERQIVAVSLAPTADATVRAGSAAGEAQGHAPALAVRTVARDGGQHKTAVALLRRVHGSRVTASCVAP